MDSDPGFWKWVAGGVASVGVLLTTTVGKLTQRFFESRFVALEDDVKSAKADIKHLQRTTAEHDTALARIEVINENAARSRDRIEESVKTVNRKLDKLLDHANGKGGN